MSMSDRTTRIARLGAAPFWAALAGAIALGAPALASAQEYRFESDGELSQLIDRVGSAMIIESDGPALVRTGPIIVEHGGLRHRWLMVQDSTMGVVFTEPSGVRTASPYYDGDIDLRALTRVIAVEVRALLFNVWREYVGQVTTTRLVEAGLGQGWAMDPRWTDLPRGPGEHRTSVMWVHRVMLSDESYFESDLSAVRRAAEELIGDGGGLDFGDPMPAVSGR